MMEFISTRSWAGSFLPSLRNGDEIDGGGESGNRHCEGQMGELVGLLRLPYLLCRKCYLKSLVLDSSQLLPFG